MKHGLNRFEFYLKQLEEHLTKASQQVNPAAWLFLSGARTQLFMLEALAKMYSDLHNENLFKKLKDHFKLLEDLLGDIDYYNYYHNQFSSSKEIPQEVSTFLLQKKEENLNTLNQSLLEKKWLGHDESRIDKIRRKLADADWMDEEQEVKAIKAYYVDSIKEINSIYSETGTRFTQMEDQVHELRRKLRWLSIYPQALRGTIQLTSSVKNDDTISKYLIPEITGSAFNVMPLPADKNVFLLLDKNNFLALSWIISEAGKLKDKGLGEVALHEFTAANKNMNTVTDDVMKLATGGETTEDILESATHIFKDFFSEKRLEKLIAGISHKLPDDPELPN